MAKAKQDPRSRIKKLKDAAYAKLPPAIICKPLQFIAKVHPPQKVINPVTGNADWVASPEYMAAREAANSGDGGFVKFLARRAASA